MRYWSLSIVLFLRFSMISSLPLECRELLSCSIREGCVNLPWLTGKMENANISAQMYNDIDTAIDYTCIFTVGCPRECTACNLCHNSKLQVLDVLSGKARKGKCPELISCATECLAQSNNMSSISHCLRRKCAFYCFNGSCPKCSSFVTKLFNQICISGSLRDKVGFQGQCPELFSAIVYAKFQEQFDSEQTRK